MREIVLNRQLLGLEDLLFGVGMVTQTRAGQSVDITSINAGNMPFDETQTLLEWVQSVNIAELGSMVTELQAVYDNLTTIGNVEDNLTVINTLEDDLVALNSLYTNISKLQNIDTNMSKLQNMDTNMSKLQNIDTNMSKLQAIYVDLTKLESIYNNLTMLLAIYNNLTALNNINSQVIPNLTELLLVNNNAAQVAADKLTVATDKGIVAGYKDDVSSMKVAVESIYNTFDDRFLGVKTNDPSVDNDGNALLDGAIYFNTSFNSLKVYSLDNTTWYTIPQIYLSGLLDVTLTSINTGDLLTWNGTKWVNTRTPSFDSIKLNGGTTTAGTATWNNTELTYDLVLNDNVTLQVGQEEVIYCKNSTATTIPNGKPVMAVGTNGNSGNILIALHDGTKTSAKRIIGLTTQPILPSNNTNPYGFVTRNGKIRGLNTTGSDYGETWVDGDILYVKATGALTKVEPLDTELKMPIAFVIHAHSNGTLYIRTTGIDENHDRDLISNKVDKVTSTDNAVVRFDGITGAVQNSSVIINDNGNVGIGLSIPKARLDVYTLGISGGLPATTGNAADPNVMARIAAASVCIDIGVEAVGHQWIQCRGISDYSLKYDLHLQPSGGNVLVTGSGGLGYGAGSGGVVNQLPTLGKGTSVLLNKPTGKIIMNNAALSPGSTITFILNNLLITQNDVIYLQIIDGSATAAGNYNIWAGATGIGSVYINLKNISSLSYSESIVIEFILFKGAIS